MAGEPLRPSDAARFFAGFGDRVALYNLYGPTETTMTRLWHRVTPADAQASSVSLGQPMAETQVFIVDSAGRQRPPERPGEIVLRTPWAALGYLDQPDATARAFVVDLLNDGSPIPVYRTGDLGVQRADGLIEFRGRRDLQVKLRGVRVELEEVEAAVCAVPTVQAAVAALRDGTDGEPRLVVWVVGADPEIGAQVRRHLVDTLPGALILSRILAVQALPRLLNGKVDRAALAVGEAPPRAAGQAPQGPVEARIAQVAMQRRRRNSYNDGAVMTVAVSGGSATVFAGTQKYASGITADGSNIYWTTAAGASGTVMKQSRTGTSPTKLACLAPPTS